MVTNIESLKTGFFWKFYGRPDTKSRLSCLFFENQIFGCNSFCSYPLVFEKRRINALLTYENFVHPKFQKKGIFKKLIELSEKNSVVENFSLLMAFPNVKSLPGYLSREWTHIEGYINYWLKPIFSRRLLLNVFDIRKKFVADIDGVKNRFEFEEFNESFYSNVITSFWDKKSLEWRFNERPQSKYMFFKTSKLESVLRLGQRGKLIELQILYLNPINDRLSKHDFKELEKKIRKKMEFDLISFPISYDNPFNKMIKKNWFYSFKSGANFVYKSNTDCYKNIKISLSGIDFHTY